MFLFNILGCSYFIPPIYLGEANYIHPISGSSKCNPIIVTNKSIPNVGSESHPIRFRITADNGVSALHAGISVDTSDVVHPVDPGIFMRSRYAHDRNGNLTYDMELETNFAYNSLNLLEKATRNDTIVAKYSYLADGTKLSVTNSGNCSFLYRGSFTYTIGKL